MVLVKLDIYLLFFLSAPLADFDGHQRSWDFGSWGLHSIESIREQEEIFFYWYWTRIATHSDPNRLPLMWKSFSLQFHVANREIMLQSIINFQHSIGAELLTRKVRSSSRNGRSKGFLIQHLQPKNRCTNCKIILLKCFFRSKIARIIQFCGAEWGNPN